MDETSYAAALAAIKDPVDQMTVRALYETNKTVTEISASLNVPRNHIYYLIRTYLGGAGFIGERTHRLGLEHLQDCADAASKNQAVSVPDCEENDPITVVTASKINVSTDNKNNAAHRNNPVSMAEIMTVNSEFDEVRELSILTPIQQLAYFKLCELICTGAPRQVPSVPDIGIAVCKVRGSTPSPRDSRAARKLWLKIHPKFSDGILPESEPDISALPKLPERRTQAPKRILPIIVPNAQAQISMPNSASVPAPNRIPVLASVPTSVPAPTKHSTPVRIEINGLKLEWETSRPDTEAAIIEVLSALTKLTDLNQIGVSAHE